MKYRKISIIFLVLLSLGMVSGLEASVNTSCEKDEVALASLNDTEGGHLGIPGTYDQDLCVEGVVEAEVRQDCLPGEVSTFSLFNQSNSHLSVYSPYRYDICTEEIYSTVRNSCMENETAALKVMGGNNTHAGDLDAGYSSELCLYRGTPENITVEISGVEADSYYAGGEPLGNGVQRFVDFPYAIGVDGTTSGIVSYGDFQKLSREGKTLSVTQSGGSFLLPHFAGDEVDVEKREEEILDRRFLKLLSPSFSDRIQENPTVRVAVRPETRIKGFSGDISGSSEITVENLGLENDSLWIGLEAD